MIRRAFKIIEIVNGEIKTLFHGINGSRVMPVNEWLRADIKIVSDGTSGTPYKSGWHTLPDYESTVEYMKRFTKRLEILRIVECEVRNTWSKEHSPSPVILSEYIKFFGEE